METVPRKTALPDSELRVCARLREFRSTRGLTRSALARQVEANRFSLANVESGRAPLRFVLAYKVCSIFNLSIRWLAKGLPPKTPFMRIDETVLAAIDDRALLTAVYNEHLEKLINERFSELGPATPGSLTLDFKALGVSVSESYFQQVLALLRQRGDQMLDEHKLQFAHRLSDVAFAFWNVPPKKEFDSITVKSNTEGVKSEMQRLRDDLKRATAKPGMKAALARFMKVDPPRVSEWLAGQEPSGKYALKLRLWADKKMGRKQTK